MKQEISHITQLGVLEMRESSANESTISDSERIQQLEKHIQYLTSLSAIRNQHQQELEQRVMTLGNQHKNLQREANELRQDKSFLQKELETKKEIEDKLISIYTDTSFLKNIYTTPVTPKERKKKKEETSEEEKRSVLMLKILNKHRKQA